MMRKIAPHLGITYHLGSLEARAQREGWTSLRFMIGAKKITLTRKQKDGGGFEAEAPALRADITLAFWPFPVRIDRVRDLSGSIHHLRFREGAKTEGAKTEGAQDQEELALPDFDTPLALPKMIRNSKVDHAEIDISEIRLADGEKFRSRLQRRNAAALSLSIEKSSPAKQRLELSVPTSNDGALLWQQLDATLDAASPSGKRLTVLARNHPECPGKSVCLNLQARYRRLSRSVPDLSTVSPCLVQISSDSRLAVESKTPCSFRGALRLSRFSSPDLEVKMRFSLQMKKKDRSPYEGFVELESNPHLVKRLVRSKLEISSFFHGDLAGGARAFHQKAKLLLQLEIPQSARLVSLLKDSRWAVPAPFNNLKGSLRLQVRSQWEDLALEAPFELDTQLESKEQSLQTHAEGKAALRTGVDHLPSGASLTANWSLSDVRLSAPHFEPHKIPRFFPASEIKTSSSASKKSKRGFQFHYAVHVSTPAAHPLLLDTNLLKEPLRIDLRGDFRDQRPAQVFLSARPVPFEIFRRNGTLEFFRYFSAPGADGSSQNTGLEGKARIRSGEYTVWARFFGDEERTRVQLSSTPPARDEELWAILLFGAPLEALSDDQQSSARAASRAVSEGALGLLSLYVFANTPIEGVHFDPATQRVAVSFRVKEGASIELGRSEEVSAELGLKKRFGKGWSFNVQVSKNREEEAGASPARVGAGVEWFTRY